MKKSVLFLVLLLGLISCKEGPNVEYVKAKEVYITKEDTLLFAGRDALVVEEIYNDGFCANIETLDTDSGTQYLISLVGLYNPAFDIQFLAPTLEDTKTPINIPYGNILKCEITYAYTDKISNQKYVERYEYDNSEKSEEFLSFTAFKYYGIKNGYVLIDKVGGLSERYINAQKEQFGDTISFDESSTSIFHYVGPQCFKFKCHIKVEN
ncbi:MAG: hypothetical protein ACI3ZZ_02990 [Candidatus Aphodosoma sp.]